MPTLVGLAGSLDFLAALGLRFPASGVARAAWPRAADARRPRVYLPTRLVLMAFGKVSV
jgi:hypothetical protein